MSIQACGYGPTNGQKAIDTQEVSKLTSDALKGALQNELKSMIEGEVTISSLQQINRFANIAQELLMVRNPIADVRRRKRVPNYAGAISQMNPSYSGDDGYAGAPGYDCEVEEEPLSGEASSNETFGAQLIRQIVPALSGMANKKVINYPELVEAIEMAKSKGLDSTVKKLEALLEPSDAPEESLEPPDPDPPPLPEPPGPPSPPEVTEPPPTNPISVGVGGSVGASGIVGTAS